MKDFADSIFFLEALTKAIENIDFAILILTPDDVTESRGTEQSSPRDNVVFELGLFIGHLGRRRCVFVYDESSPIKLPSDLLGIAGAPFAKPRNGNMLAALAQVRYSLQQRVREIGPRPKLLKFAHHDLTRSDLPPLIGEWAGYSPDGPTPDEQTSTLTLHQMGSFVRASVIYKKGRVLEFEGRFASGQLVLFFLGCKRPWIHRRNHSSPLGFGLTISHRPINLLR